MLNLLKWNKKLMVNDKVYNNADEAREALKDYQGKIEIKLNFKEKNTQQKQYNEFRIEVKQYMTKESSPSFDFMKKWNNDKPMPMRIMQGTILEETKGMYKMNLRGIIEPSNKCLHCARPLTNPVSFNYGIGPICGGHFNIAEPKTEAEFRQRKAEIKKQLEEQTKWTGWVIKSAITNIKEIKRKKTSA